MMHRLLISLGLGLTGSLGILSAAYAVSGLTPHQEAQPPLRSGSIQPITICESRVC
jgi:hypothetical protein